LHLGNIDFDEKSFDDPKMPSQPGKIKNTEQVEVVANLLGIADWKTLEKALLAELKTDPGKKGSTYWKFLGCKKCSDNRDALAKQIFY